MQPYWIFWGFIVVGALGVYLYVNYKRSKLIQAQTRALEALLAEIRKGRP